MPLKMDNVRTIFLDYDGTLHNSMTIYAPAFRKAYENLVDKGHAEPRSWSEEDISKWIGFNPKEMWERFMPDLSRETRDTSSELIGREMNELIKKGYPKLYENAIDTLEYLKSKGYTLVFLSNCRKEYMENHRKLFSLDKYFDSMICSEEFGFIQKQNILKTVIENYPKERVMVGDRKKDLDAGRASGIFTIGCKYGFGSEEELTGADLLIDDISELKNIF